MSDEGSSKDEKDAEVDPIIQEIRDFVQSLREGIQQVADSAGVEVDPDTPESDPRVTEDGDTTTFHLSEPVVVALDGPEIAAMAKGMFLKGQEQEACTLMTLLRINEALAALVREHDLDEEASSAIQAEFSEGQAHAVTSRDEAEDIIRKVKAARDNPNGTLH